jgi:SAM-dependent methyltransferase
MQFFHYFKYFFYIALNWNTKLALFTIYHEIRGEKKYAIRTSQLNDLTKLKVKGNNKKHAEIYQGTNYFLLENVLSYLQNIGRNNSIIDFGCGKGRVLAVAAFYGFNKITGIDFSEELCNEARSNISPIRLRFPEKTFNVIHINAVDFKIEDDVTVFFFFNPFNEIVLMEVIDNMLLSIKKNKRIIYVAYINPRYRQLFVNAGFVEVYYIKKMEYVEASILCNIVEIAA